MYKSKIDFDSEQILSMDKTNNNIDGVKIITKKVISDDRGKIYICLKMMTVNIKI